MTLIRCRSPQIPCYHYIITSISDTYPCWSNKIVVIVGLCNQGLRICNTQTTHLPINIMSNYKAFSLAVSGVVATMAIVCHLGVQALDKATAEQCKTHAWPQAAHQIHMDWCADNGYATNWVPGVMPGGQTSHSVLPPAEMGTAQFRSSHGRLRCCTWRSICCTLLWCVCNQGSSSTLYWDAFWTWWLLCHYETLCPKLIR